MSGRLVILPKKSYCPWNPENVERVLRDEAEHARQQEQERQQEQKEASILRRKQLAPSSSTSEERFSLFAAEEKEYNNKMVSKAVSPPVANKGVHPEYLGASVRNAPTPFYLDHPSSTGTATNPKEERRKNQLDPMKDICPSRPSTISTTHPEVETTRKGCDETTVKDATRDNKSRSSKTSRRKRYSSDSDSDSDSSNSDHSAERSRRRKHRRSKHSRRHAKEEKQSKRRRKHKESDEAVPVPVAGPSIEELRKERLEREALERQRQESLIQRERGGHQRTRYQDQYNPRFSRN